MKRKALCFILTLLAIAVFSLGCGGGGGSSNPASSNVAGFARVSGVVYDSSNNPVANANVRLVLSSNALINSLTSNTTSNLRLATNGYQTEFNTNTDNKGEYTFVNVPYGEYTLSAVTANGAQIVTSLVVKDEAVETPKIILKPFGSISGKVTYNNNPVTGAIVYIDGTSFCSVTDSVGSYTLSYVPATSTPYVLKVYASGMILNQNYTVEAVVPSDNTSESLIWKKDLVLVDDTSIPNSNALTINLEEGKTFDGDLMLFTVSSDNTTTYAGCIPTGKTSCTIYIKDKGNYKIIPALLSKTSYIFAHSFVGKSGDVAISEEDETISVSGSGSVTITFGTDSNSSYGTLNLTVNTTGNFTASLFDSTGHENKMTISGTGSFKNLVPGQYALAVYSDTMLKVETGIELEKGKTTEKTITPVTVIGDSDGVTISQNTGIATLKLNYSSGNPATDVDKDNLYFSLIGKGKDGAITLFDENVATTTFKVTSSNITKNFSIDNLSPNTDSIAYIKFFFKNGLNKNIFEQSFFIQNPMTIAPDSFKRVSLGNISQSEDVILFKTLYNSYDKSIHYLVVTKDKAYVFSSNGSIEKTVDFSEKFRAILGITDLNVEIKYGNATYLDDDSNQALAIQFTVPSADGSGKNELYIYKYSFNTLIGTTDAPERLLPTGNNANTGDHYYVYSPNKLLLTSNGCLSVCDNFILYNNGTTWSNEIYFGEPFDDNTSNKKYVIASFTTIVPTSENKYSIYYINHEFDNSKNNGGYKIYLGVNDLEENYSSTEFKRNYEVGDYYLTTDASGNCKKEDSTFNGKSYGYYELLTNEYPYSLTDCLDNKEATNKAFVNDGYSWISSPINTDSKYVFSDTLYSGANIESSYRTAGNFDTWIARNSNGQVLKLRNKTTYKEKSLSIKQVFNSSAFLENSIGYTESTKQIHVLTTDDSDSANLQVLVLNCIESNN